jgi:protein-export membrane protein SecD/preprotein translocase SecF subunit
MSKEYRWKFPLIIAVVVWAILSAFPLDQKINKGIDLKGGSELLYRVSLDEVDKTIADNQAKIAKLSAGEERTILEKSNTDLLESKKGVVVKAIDIVRLRINQKGIEEIPVQKQGTDRVLIQLPGMTAEQVNEIKRIIAKQGVLTFQIVAPEGKTAQDEGFASYPNKDGGEVVLYKKAELDGSMVANAAIGVAQMGGWEVSLQMTGAGRKAFADVTRANIKNQMAIVLDGVVQSAPTIKSVIGDGQASITGRFSKKEATELVAVLNAGSMPARLEFMSESFVGPTLGEDSVNKGIKACLYGLAAVFVFTAVYYLLGGIITNIALLINLLLLLAFMAVFGATMTLPGIAGIILTVGMCVDANVLIFERIREELKDGSALGLAVKQGYDRAFITIVDSNLTTLITAFILAQFGTGPVKGFAVTLSIGIVCSMFSALFVTRTCIQSLIELGTLKKLSMAKLVGETKMPFVSFGKITLVVSLVLVVIGLGVFSKNVNNHLDIDFTGGTLIQFKLDDKTTIKDVRAKLSAQNSKYAEAAIQTYAANEEDKTASEVDQFTVRVADRTAEDVEMVKQDIEKAFGIKDQLRSETFPRIETVGPMVANELKSSAIISILLAIVVIILYITMRFEFKFGLAAIIALVHDVSITLGVFALMDKKISLPMIAAILTIIGYSLNDTIVVFDRIRENMRKMSRASFGDILNISINQTLSRTLLTSLTTLLVVVILFLFGGGVIEDFAFTLIVGVVVGTYSSIFIASPVLYMWHNKKVASSEPQA